MEINCPPLKITKYLKKNLNLLNQMFTKFDITYLSLSLLADHLNTLLNFLHEMQFFFSSFDQFIKSPRPNKYI